MNSSITRITSVVVFAALFTTLFYKQNFGLNVLLFETSLIGFLFFSKRITTNKEVLLTVAGTLLTALMVVVHNSILAILINMMSVYLMIGTLLIPKARSLPHSALMSVVHSLMSHIELVKEFGQLGSTYSRFGSVVKWLRIVAIPVFIVLIFITMYSAANPVFDGMLEGITRRIDQFASLIAEWIELGVLAFFIFSMFVCDFLVLKTVEKNLERNALNEKDDLERKRKPNRDLKIDLGLKREWRSGILLLGALNLLLLLINIIDIYWVWFNFEWNGDYLKQFVHEGTSILIISILISIAISMYLFRGNQNFFSKGIWLKRLAIAWLVQNMVLALSVGVRNFHYIQYYALAHKRIGVVFFLVATLIGLALVIIKIKDKKTLHFVFRTNAISIYTILVIMTCVNWDVFIVKYNFKNYESTFTHFDFLWDLSYTTLPYQHQSLEFLKKVELSNRHFPSDVEYLTPVVYQERVKNSTIVFKDDWEDRDWRSWNWAYQNAYSKLK